MSNEEHAAAPTGGRPGLVLTAVGPDRPGLVKGLAAHLRKLGGNIEDTRMSKLGGEFAVLLLVTGSDAALSELTASKTQLEAALGVSCFFKKTTTSARTSGANCFALHASGMDHPGIVESVTDVLAVRRINVASLSSRLENAPLSGTPMFVLDAEMELPDGLNLADLHDALREVCEREDLEFSLDKIEG